MWQQALVAGTVVAVYVGLAWSQLGLPLIYDDVNFAFAAQAVARTGLPFANAGHMSERWDFSLREQWALWHPPLYIYLLGLQARLFGTGEVALRALGLAFNLGTAGLTYCLARSLGSFGPGRSRAVGLLAVALYLLSPLTVQSGLILDIDGTVLTFLLAALGLAAVRLPPRPGPLLLLRLGALFALALWAKTTTPIGLLACVLLYQLLRGRPWLAARMLVAVGLGGTLLFVLTWWLLAWAFSMPFDMPFAVVWIELLDAAGSSRAWLASQDAFLGVALPPVLWASPALCVLFALAGLWRLGRFARRPVLEPLDLAVGFGTLVFGVYLIKLAGGFPKYHVAMLPFWAAAAAHLVTSVAPPLSRFETGLLGLVGLTLAGSLLWLFPDLWAGQPLEAPLGLMVALLVAGVAAVALLLRLAAARPLGHGALLGLAVAALAWGPGVEPRLAANGGSTTYFYGTHGQREAAAAVDALVEPDEAYAAAKEVAWYARNQRYVDQDTLEHFMRPVGPRFDGAVLGYELRVVAVWTRPSTHPPFYAEGLSRRFDLVGRYGDYQVYTRREPLPPMSAEVLTPTLSPGRFLSSPSPPGRGSG